MNLKSEFKALAKPALRKQAFKCLAWRILLIPFAIISIPYMILATLSDGLLYIVKSFSVFEPSIDYISDKIRSEYKTARELRAEEEGTPS